MTHATPAGAEGAARVDLHRVARGELQELSDEEVLSLLGESDLLERGHTALALPKSGAQVFVKLLPLSALELEPEQLHSTANYFRLPANYHYRVASSGFGAWRELEAHRLANRWVLSGSCPHFPLLHGWRVVPLVYGGPDDRLSLTPWGDDVAIRGRVSAIAGAKSSLALFLEWFPLTLSQSLEAQLASAPDPLALVSETEASLLEILAFLRGQGFLHLDAHFENVLSDGRELFLSDFGLSLSRAFALDADELEFLESHQSFDPATAITSLVHALVSRYAPSDPWRQSLREVLGGSHDRLEEIPTAIRAYLARRGPVALAAGEFYRQWTQGRPGTEFPWARVERLLDLR